MRLTRRQNGGDGAALPARATSPMRALSPTRGTLTEDDVKTREILSLQRLIKLQLPAEGVPFVSNLQTAPVREHINALLRVTNAVHEEGKLLHRAVDKHLAALLAAKLAGIQTSVAEWLHDEELLASVLHAYVLICYRNPEGVDQLSQIPMMFTALLRVMAVGSIKVTNWACLLLSQLAIASPEAAVEISEMPGLSQTLVHIIASADSHEHAQQLDSAQKCATNAVLLINNIAGTGGEAAITALAREANLVTTFLRRLQSSSDLESLQRRLGVVRVAGGGGGV